jgi:hypothetical protein
MKKALPEKTQNPLFKSPKGGQVFIPAPSLMASKKAALHLF